MRLLFVCMGNICRSPAAEGVMKHQLEAAGLAHQVEVDSAGTINLHAGNAPDRRMTEAAARRGIPLRHRARQVTAQDLQDFDLVLVMDQANLDDVLDLDQDGRHRSKIQLFCDYCTDHPHKEVPDPYYGGPAGFELVLDLLEDGCANLLRKVTRSAPATS